MQVSGTSRHHLISGIYIMANKIKKTIEQHLLQKHREFADNKKKFGITAGVTLTSGYATAALMNLYKDLFGSAELKSFVRLNFEEGANE